MPERVKLGLARSFQITSILPGFTALENVALAVQARRLGNEAVIHGNGQAAEAVFLDEEFEYVGRVFSAAECDDTIKVSSLAFLVFNNVGQALFQFGPEAIHFFPGWCGTALAADAVLIEADAGESSRQNTLNANFRSFVHRVFPSQEQQSGSSWSACQKGFPDRRFLFETLFPER